MDRVTGCEDHQALTTVYSLQSDVINELLWNDFDCEKTHSKDSFLHKIFESSKLRREIILST